MFRISEKRDIIYIKLGFRLVRLENLNFYFNLQQNNSSMSYGISNKYSLCHYIDSSSRIENLLFYCGFRNELGIIP